MRKLRFWSAMSTLCALLCGGTASAHEVVPTIADLTVADGTVQIDIRVNVEAQLSGIDLDAVSDTDSAENAEDYDVLRALPDAEVAARVPALLATWNALPLVSGDGVPIALMVQTVAVPVVANPDLPRVTDISLSGGVPAGTTALDVAWPKGAGDLIVRQQGVDEPYTGLISGGGASGPISITGGGSASGWGTFVAYIPVGFDHILPKGLDHILFVLGLFFLSTRLAPLVWQITSFTLAHTVTLALGTLGIVTIPASIVEPLIAASIVYVAIENLFARGLTPWRPAIVFVFGLLHGLGFASVLGTFGLPDGQVLPALIGFNVGVELGQLAVIALAASALWLGVRAARVSDLAGQEETITDYNVMFRAWSITGSVIIAAIAVFWVIERTLF